MLSFVDSGSYFPAPEGSIICLDLLSGTVHQSNCQPCKNKRKNHRFLMLSCM